MGRLGGLSGWGRRGGERVGKGGGGGGRLRDEWVEG